MKSVRLTLNRRIRLNALAGLLAGAFAIASPSPVSAIGPVTGELGVDLESFSYSGIHIEPYKSIAEPGGVFETDITRTLSNHYLRLGMSGPVVNSNFANYSLRAKLFGTYFRTKTNIADIDKYDSPTLRAYSAQLTFFPSRRYPLRLYHSRAREFALRYEPSNRSDIELVQPQLAVVRSYEADVTSNGAQLQYAFSENLSLTTELKDDQRKTLRNYDLSEDRNLWVVFTTVILNPLKPVDEVLITNTLPDADLIVVVDTMVIDTVVANQEIRIDIDSGSHQVELIPTRFYNQMSFRIVMRGDMSWKVVYNPPATPNDQDQSSTAFNANLEYDANGAFSNRTFVESSKQKESFQNLLTNLTNISNTAKLQIRKNLSGTVLSTYNATDAELIDISLQENKSALNTTTLSWSPKKNVVSDFSHSFNRNQSRTVVGPSISEVISKLHTLNTRTRVPSRRFNNVLTLKGDYSRLRDSKDYGTNQHGFSVINEFKFKLKGLELEPRQDLKYSVSTVHEPETDDSGVTVAVNSSSTTEIEPKFSLLGIAPPSKKFGDFRFKLEYNYRDRYDDEVSTTTSKYYLDLSLVKKFSKSFRALLSTSRETEKYGGSVNIAVTGEPEPGKPDEKQSTYRIDLQFTPREDISIGTGTMFIKQDENTIRKLTLMISLTIPKLRIPVRSFISNEKRDIAGLDPQITTNAETKLSYRIRQITLVLTHRYTKEELIGQTFALHEAKAELKRNFSMFE